MRPSKGQVRFGTRARAREALLALSCAAHGLYRLAGARNQMTCGRCRRIKSPRALYLSPIPGRGAPELSGWFSIKLATDNRREADYLPTCRSCLTLQAWKRDHVGRKERRRSRRREAPLPTTTQASTGNATSPPDAPKMVEGVAVIQVIENWLFDGEGKLVLPPVRDGWRLTLADGKQRIWGRPVRAGASPGA
jgi:hypothetical protein